MKFGDTPKELSVPLARLFEVAVHEALAANQIILNWDELCRDCLWQILPDGSRTLYYKGKPIIEFGPLLLNLTKEKVIAAQSYRIIKAENTDGETPNRA